MRMMKLVGYMILHVISWVVMAFVIAGISILFLKLNTATVLSLIPVYAVLGLICAPIAFFGILNWIEDRL